MKKPKLAVFNTQPPHLYFGGVESRIMETSKRLGNEVNITVYSGTKNGFKKPVSTDDTRIVPCFSTDVMFPLDNWFFNRTISNAVPKIVADVYEAHTVSGYAFLRRLKKKPQQSPFIQTIHGVLADEYYQAVQSGGLSLRERVANLLMWQLSKLEAEAARNADVVVTVSHYSKKRIAQIYGVDEAKIRVVPNGVDPEKFKPSSDGENFEQKCGLNKKRVVLFVGRLIPRKGLLFLVEAAKHVVEERKDAVFVIVGNGPLRSKLATTLEKLNLSRNFVFMGDVEEHVLTSLYGSADLFALPSIQEGQGIVLLEAQASAKPVVAFKIGGVQEAVANGKSGLLVERGNSVELAEAIVKLLSNAPLRQKMGSAGREFVLRSFTWDLCAERMLSIYDAVLGAR
jgi:glycosyltransferase involved in cell wall biosynthesis